MRLTMKERQAVTGVTVQRYRQGSKKVKRQILDEFCRPLVTLVIMRVCAAQSWPASVAAWGKRVVVGDAVQKCKC